MQNSIAYNKINEAWKDSCRVIFGKELGDLKEYKEWLSMDMESMNTKKSMVSGKDVCCAVPHYCEGAKFISLDEVDFNKRFEPLNINEIKDIDSIVEALQERFYYTGNVILANSRFVEESSNISNSFYMFHSNYASDSKYAAYSSYLRYSKCMFGVNEDALSSFVIRGFDLHRVSRGFEVWRTFSSNDCYYTYGVEDCNNVLFSFNTKSKKYVIGNLELSREKFASLKKKLLGEIIDGLEGKKTAPSLMDFIPKDLEKTRAPKVETRIMKKDENKELIEEAFRRTTKIVFGKELTEIDRYGEWLAENMPGVTTVESAVSESPVYLGLYVPYTHLPKERLVKEAESKKLGEIVKLEESEIGSIEEIKKSLQKIAFFTPETRMGDNANLIYAAVVARSVNCYKGALFAYNENCAFSFWSRNSKYMFGSALAFSSHSCIRCYNSLNLSRCFETDGSSNSSDLYFCHNCENVQNSMFTFNTKNLKNAIGNAPLSLEDYKKVKGNLLEQIIGEIEEKGSLKWSIYNIGCEKD